MLRRALILLLAASAALPSTAAASTYMVVGTGDGDAGCRASSTGATNFECDSLRAAIAVASAAPGNAVYLPGGTYSVTQAQLTLASDVTLVGANARAVTIQRSGSGRIFVVPPGATPSVYGVTISGGNQGNGSGGNILNQGELLLANVRVTGGTAANGGGIANVGGDLSVFWSLIDNNQATGGQGGGISNEGVSAGAASTLQLLDTTVAFNTASGGGGGIRSFGNAGNDVDLLAATIGRNSGSGSNPGGIAVDDGSASAQGSIIATNFGDSTPSNCGGAVTDQGGNISDNTDCEFSNTGDPLLDTQLSYLGGHTPVLAIPSESPAKNRVQPCPFPLDQRLATRPASSCDAGAYQQGVDAPALGDATPLAPTAPPPPPPPAPTPSPTATPVAGKSVAGTTVEGKVLVKTPGGKFVALDPTKPIPLGSTIDTKNGTIQLTAQQKKNGKPQTAKFFDGIFKITQTKTTTDLTLNEALAKCPKSKSAHAAAKKPKTRKLWGNGSGSFRTRGQYSAATVRGTEWLVQDSCSGTLTRVKKGVVSVRDNVKRKTIVLRAGKRYLAKPRR
jgi:hypothetical protein